MEIGTLIHSSLESRIQKRMFQNIKLGENSLVTMKKSFLDVATENILLTGNQDDLVDDFGFLLDYLEKCTSFTEIGKVRMYGIYIKMMTQIFNNHRIIDQSQKKLISETIPNFTNEGRSWRIVEEEDTIFFTHGYDATHSGKEAAIALFQYIDSNFIKKKAPYKVKDKG